MRALSTGVVVNSRPANLHQARGKFTKSGGLRACGAGWPGHRAGHAGGPPARGTRPQPKVHARRMLIMMEPMNLKAELKATKPAQWRGRCPGRAPGRVSANPARSLATREARPFHWPDCDVYDLCSAAWALAPAAAPMQKPNTLDQGCPTFGCQCRMLIRCTAVTIEPRRKRHRRRRMSNHSYRDGLITSSILRIIFTT
jgi:hypothetical protein